MQIADFGGTVDVRAWMCEGSSTPWNTKVACGRVQPRVLRQPYYDCALKSRHLKKGTGAIKQYINTIYLTK
jgi:hypothetical protein